jgi:hypothetical protein
MNLARFLLAAALSAGCIAASHAVDGKAVIGGGLGGAAGAAVGSAVAGDTGAIVGAGVGAAAGAAIATHDSEPRKTVVEKRVIHVHEDRHPGKRKGHYKHKHHKYRD